MAPRRFPPPWVEEQPTCGSQASSVTVRLPIRPQEALSISYADHPRLILKVVGLSRDDVPSMV
jgi:hypothetical protein